MKCKFNPIKVNSGPRFSPSTELFPQDGNELCPHGNVSLH